MSKENREIEVLKQRVRDLEERVAMLEEVLAKLLSENLKWKIEVSGGREK